MLLKTDIDNIGNFFTLRPHVSCPKDGVIFNPYQRFWHVTGYLAGKFPFLSMILENIDKVLEKIPFVKLLSWMFTFELIKPKDK